MSAYMLSTFSGSYIPDQKIGISSGGGGAHRVADTDEPSEVSPKVAATGRAAPMAAHEEGDGPAANPIKPVESGGALPTGAVDAGGTTTKTQKSEPINTVNAGTVHDARTTKDPTTPISVNQNARAIDHANTMEPQQSEQDKADKKVDNNDV